MRSPESDGTHPDLCPSGQPVIAAAGQAETDNDVENTHCSDCGQPIKTLLWGGLCGNCLDAGPTT